VHRPAEWQFPTLTPQTIVRGVHVRALFHRNSAIFYGIMHDVYDPHMLPPCRFSGCVLDTPVRVGPRYNPPTSMMPSRWIWLRETDNHVVGSMLLDRGGSSRLHLVFRLQIDRSQTSALSAFQNMVTCLSKVPQSKILKARVCVTKASQDFFHDLACSQYKQLHHASMEMTPSGFFPMTLHTVNISSFIMRAWK
jgi:hypothetical protein